MKRNCIDSLTSIRFFAALLVVLAHYGASLFQVGSPLHFCQRVINQGFAAVGLFFCLSGFVLAYNYDDRSVNLARFWQARFARVYPLYFIAFLLVLPVVFQQWISQDAHLRFACNGPCTRQLLIASLILTVVMLQSWKSTTASVFNPPSWSLSAEAFFYFLFPFLLGVRFLRHPISRTSFILGVAGIWIAAIAFPTFLTFHVDSPAIAPWVGIAWFSPLSHVPSFFAGMVAGCFYQQHRNDFAVSRWSELLVLITMMAAMAILYGAPVWLGLVIQTGLLIPVWSFMFLGLAYNGRTARLLSHPILVFLGNASYAMYILQQPVSTYLRWIVARLTKTPLARDFTVTSFLVYLSLLIAISGLSYRYVESPLRERLTRWRTQSRPELPVT